MFSPGEMANVDAGYPGETDFLQKRGFTTPKKRRKRTPKREHVMRQSTEDSSSGEF